MFSPRSNVFWVAMNIEIETFETPSAPDSWEYFDVTDRDLLMNWMKWRESSDSPEKLVSSTHNTIYKYYDRSGIPLRKALKSTAPRWCCSIMRGMRGVRRMHSEMYVNDLGQCNCSWSQRIRWLHPRRWNKEAPQWHETSGEGLSHWHDEGANDVDTALRQKLCRSFPLTLKAPGNVVALSCVSSDHNVIAARSGSRNSKINELFVLSGKNNIKTKSKTEHRFLKAKTAENKKKRFARKIFFYTTSGHLHTRRERATGTEKPRA